MYLVVEPNDAFKPTDHFPLLAGLAPDGDRLFTADTSGEAFCGVMHAVAEGTRPGDLRLRTHYTDGRTYDEDLYPQKNDKMHVLCLCYDPTLYKNNGIPSMGLAGMDTTGPYSWKSSRKLPADGREKDRSFCTPVEDPYMSWEEVVHELKQEVTQDLTDDDLPVDTVLVPQELIQEANIWSKE